MAVGLALGTKRLPAVQITTTLLIAIVVGFFVKRLIVDVPHLLNFDLAIDRASGSAPNRRTSRRPPTGRMKRRIRRVASRYCDVRPQGVS